MITEILAQGTEATRFERFALFDTLYGTVDQFAQDAGLSFEIIPLGREAKREIQVCVSLDDFVEPRSLVAAKRLVFLRLRAAAMQFEKMAERLESLDVAAIGHRQ